MRGVKKITSYRTSDNKLFPSFDEAQSHEEEIDAQELMQLNDTFRKGIYKAVDFIVFEVYVNMTFKDKKSNVPLDLKWLEATIGKPLISSHQLTAYATELQNVMNELALDIVLTSESSNDDASEISGSKLIAQPADVDNSFNKFALAHKMDELMFPFGH
mgnify:CR=1 FL=1